MERFNLVVVGGGAAGLGAARAGVRRGRAPSWSSKGLLGPRLGAPARPGELKVDGWQVGAR